MTIGIKAFKKELLRNNYLKKYKKEQPEKYDKIIEVVNAYEKDTVRNYNDIASCVEKISKVLGLTQLEKTIMIKYIKNRILKYKAPAKKEK